MFHDKLYKNHEKVRRQPMRYLCSEPSPAQQGTHITAEVQVRYTRLCEHGEEGLMRYAIPVVGAEPCTKRDSHYRRNGNALHRIA